MSYPPSLRDTGYVIKDTTDNTYLTWWNQGQHFLPFNCQVIVYKSVGTANQRRLKLKGDVRKYIIQKVKVLIIEGDVL